MEKNNWVEISEKKFFEMFEENRDSIEKVEMPFTTQFNILNESFYCGKVTFEDDECWYILDQHLFYSESDFNEHLSQL